MDTGAIPYFSVMHIGYACINRSLDCTSSSTFRLASYSKKRLIETVRSNLACLERILRFNVEHGILFFRISSELIPFASHPVNRMDWAGLFGPELHALGRFIRGYRMRMGMHPDQFVVLNSNRPEVVESSVAELAYHAKLLDAMGLPARAKIQIHLGAAYGDKKGAMAAFVRTWRTLDRAIKRRLVIENDDRLFSVGDCLWVSGQTGIPIVLDTFHHECLNNGEGLGEAMESVSRTWRKIDGIPIVDYSSQNPDKRPGAHADTLDPKHFLRVIKDLAGVDLDLMIEIKDKEESALKALRILQGS